MTDTTPAALERIVERLRKLAETRAKITADMARDKTLRNRAAGEHDALYAGVSKEETDEWKAAAVIAALGVERNKVDEARRIDQESAIKWIQEAGRQAERATPAEAELRARDAAPIVGEREFRFDRYVRGKLMAEGVVVHAETESAARAKARALYSDDPSVRVTAFRLSLPSGGGARKAAAEIEKMVAELCKPWTAFYGHADEFAAIITKHIPAGLTDAMRIVNEQAEDGGIWFVAQAATEAYLQQELRRLHTAIEGKTAEQIDAEAIARLTGGQK